MQHHDVGGDANFHVLFEYVCTCLLPSARVTALAELPASALNDGVGSMGIGGSTSGSALVFARTGRWAASIHLP